MGLSTIGGGGYDTRLGRGGISVGHLVIFV